MSGGMNTTNQCDSTGAQRIARVAQMVLSFGCFNLLILFSVLYVI
jgi:hypothetical protein